ncbi:MAG: STAS/SEC14 domain-containing protein [Gammaproteobacteria bacterium]|nr:STAS/SEC14 domain-containing protein [Gammaproteobacteria bacterium]
MFKVTKNGLNRIDIEFSGKLNSDDMKVALDDLLNSSKDIENGRMLYRLSDFNIPTLGALGVELSRIPELFRFVKKFDRIAVIVDKEWVKKATELEGAIIPGLKIKAFDLDEQTEAEKWLVR